MSCEMNIHFDLMMKSYSSGYWDLTDRFLVKPRGVTQCMHDDVTLCLCVQMSSSDYEYACTRNDTLPITGISSGLMSVDKKLYSAYEQQQSCRWRRKPRTCLRSTNLEEPVLTYLSRWNITIMAALNQILGAVWLDDLDKPLSWLSRFFMNNSPKCFKKLFIE